MNTEALERTVLDARRINAGIGRSGRGRFVDATEVLNTRITLANQLMQDHRALYERWEARQLRVMEPRELLFRTRQDIPDSPLPGTPLDKLLNFGATGCGKLRWLGLRCGTVKCPFHLLLAALVSDILRGAIWDLSQL